MVCGIKLLLFAQTDWNHLDNLWQKSKPVFDVWKCVLWVAELCICIQQACVGAMIVFTEVRRRWTSVNSFSFFLLLYVRITQFISYIYVLFIYASRTEKIILTDRQASSSQMLRHFLNCGAAAESQGEAGCWCWLQLCSSRAAKDE